MQTTVTELANVIQVVGTVSGRGLTKDDISDSRERSLRRHGLGGTTTRGHQTENPLGTAPAEAMVLCGGKPGTRHRYIMRI